MIQKPGTVTITADEILISEFEFNGKLDEGANLSTCQQEGIAWAIDRLRSVLARQESK